MPRSIAEIVIETVATSGEGDLPSEYELIKASKLVTSFEDSDVALWLSMGAGFLLASAIKKVINADTSLDEDEVEDLLTPNEKSIIYASFILSDISE